ncbi:acid sphingomyelinase-like phosphodiesterase 3b [Mya arenaria]|uniref:acid sphingomyelinase-like phosphodiesterase 3b n=1 Tax=Mya arenaria TaxID=6604 RepID=UPI0022E32940|nr:acid sphingomyelinase-like phosphodiesterase 3b [Mya arenaria]
MMARLIQTLSVLFCVFGNVYTDIGYFWHITDFHYDFTYYGRQLSCNPNAKPTEPGKYGDFWCDSPWALVNSSVQAMAKHRADVDFILWTGDTVLHTGNENLNYTINADILDNVTEIIDNVMGSVPVFATFGNHDYYPNNQFPPTNNLLYNDTWDRWGAWIGDVTQEGNFRKGAYYTKKTDHGLRIVALNTNLYYTSNKAVLGSNDPGDQLSWLNQTLAEARRNNERVLVTAHIPPGPHTPSDTWWMHEQFHTPLVETLRRYTDVIVAMHFGHDHADGFKVLSGNSGNHKAPIFMAPSVTPWRYIIPNVIGPAHNPGIRLVKYERTTGRHLDIQQYYLDLENANNNGSDIWGLEYTATSAYGIDDLTAESLEKAIEKIKKPGSEEFNRYVHFHDVSPPVLLKEECDHICHGVIVCGFTHFDVEGYEQCKTDMTSGAGKINVSVMAFLLIYHLLRYLQ